MSSSLEYREAPLRRRLHTLPLSGELHVRTDIVTCEMRCVIAQAIAIWRGDHAPVEVHQAAMQIRRRLLLGQADDYMLRAILQTHMVDQVMTRCAGRLRHFSAIDAYGIWWIAPDEGRAAALAVAYKEQFDRRAEYLALTSGGLTEVKA